MGVKIPRSPWWRFKKLRRDDDDNDDNNIDDKDGEMYRDNEKDEEEEEHQHSWQWQWQWKFATSSSSCTSWRLKKKKKKLRPINLVFPLRCSLSFSLDDIVFRILYVIEAIVLVATICFYFCCCGCHV